MKIGLGIVTFSRPQYLAECVASVEKHLLGRVDHIYVYNDGGYLDQFEETYLAFNPKIRVIHAEKNEGVAFAKNRLLDMLLRDGCDYLFLLEDDLVVDSIEAVDSYIKASQEGGVHHLNFHAHGPANEGATPEIDGVIAKWPHLVGAWSFYTRECLEECGLLDEHFVNANEHVEHYARIAQKGMTTPFWQFADVLGSENYLHEIPGSIDNSSIRQDPLWQKRIEDSLIYWKGKDGIGLPKR